MVAGTTLLPSNRHSRRGGGPHESRFVARQAVGGIHEAAEAMLDVQGRGGLMRPYSRHDTSLSRSGDD